MSWIHFCTHFCICGLNVEIFREVQIKKNTYVYTLGMAAFVLVMSC